MASNRFRIPVKAEEDFFLESTMVQAIYNCGNSKSQVPGSSGSDTLTCLTLHSKAPKVIDAAICWNYMVTTIYLCLLCFVDW